MEVIYFDSNKKYELGNLAVTIGAFDGIHTGHYALIDSLLMLDKVSDNTSKYKKAVITFSSHPDYILNKRTDLGVITTLEEKENLFASLGLDYLIILPSSKEFFSLSYLEFNQLLKKLNVQAIVVGKDFKYGKNGLGNYLTLQDDFFVQIVPTVTKEGEKISSSTLRELLKEGKIEEINQMLKEPFSISGYVETGSKIGNSLGFPTVNIKIGEKYQNIRYGVYACTVYYQGQEYCGCANIGLNPTLNKVNTPRLEVHIIDFDKKIYGEFIKVELKKFLRDEKKFATREELIKAITADVMEARKK